MADDNAENVQPKNRAVVSQRVLFVRNLPFSTTDQDLETLFSEVGPIKRCFVIRNKGKKLCKILHVAYREILANTCILKYEACLFILA